MQNQELVLKSKFFWIDILEVYHGDRDKVQCRVKKPTPSEWIANQFIGVIEEPKIEDKKKSPSSSRSLGRRKSQENPTSKSSGASQQ